MIRFVLMDIEGTTTSIHFVHEVLFPHATTHLNGFVLARLEEERVRNALGEVKQTVYAEEGRTPDDEGAIQILLDWIQADRKHTALKALQGYLWKEGYESGQYKGHLYPDVVPAWEKWTRQGRQLGIYSSGSVEAQKLLFRYSEEGDLTPFLSAYFDTRVGHKRETGSYHSIREQLGIPPGEILFLSDVYEELDAAREVGFQTIQVVREGNDRPGSHHLVNSFSDIDL